MRSDGSARGPTPQWHRAVAAGVRRLGPSPLPTLPFLALLGGWVLLNVADVTSTLLAMPCSGLCVHVHEHNLIVLALFRQGGVRALVLDKGLATAAGVGLLPVGWRHLPRGVFWLAAVVNAGVAYTVANNAYWLIAR